jgi:hypothetical protein
MCSSIIVLTLENKVPVLGSVVLFIIRLCGETPWDLELIARSGLLDGWASLMQNRAGQREAVWDREQRTKPITLILSLFCTGQMKIILLACIRRV